MNLVNPNDLLATRVTDIAKTNSEEGFIKGALFSSMIFYFVYILNMHCFDCLAAKSFHKFKDTFLSEIYSEIMAHSQQEATGHFPKAVPGITVHDSDVLEPEPVRQGGLMRKDSVRLATIFPLTPLLTM